MTRELGSPTYYRLRAGGVLVGLFVGSVGAALWIGACVVVGSWAGQTLAGQRSLIGMAEPNV